MNTAAEGVAALRLYKAQCEGRISPAGRYYGINDRARAWLCSFLVDFDEKKANEVAGYGSRHNEKYFMSFPNKLLAFNEAQGRIQEESELKAVYVRDFLYQVLEFCPGDAFSPMPGGKWGITKEGYDGLPQKVRRLIVSMDMQGEWCSVKFVSKEEALRLAARFTLTQNHIIDDKRIPWELLAQAALAPREDNIEKLIASVGAETPHNGNGNGSH